MRGPPDIHDEFAWRPVEAAGMRVARMEKQSGYLDASGRATGVVGVLRQPDGQLAQLRVHLTRDGIAHGEPLCASSSAAWQRLERLGRNMVRAGLSRLRHFAATYRQRRVPEHAAPRVLSD